MTWIQHFRQNIQAYVLGCVSLMVVLVCAEQLWESYQSYQLRHQPVEEWLEYHTIAYVNEDREARAGRGSLRMLSDTTIHRPVELDYLDVLYCRPPGGTEFEYISQNPLTSEFRRPRSRLINGWLYNADYPRGRECQVMSVITATVDGVEKKIEIMTPVFVVGSA